MFALVQGKIPHKNLCSAPTSFLLTALVSERAPWHKPGVHRGLGACTPGPAPCEDSLHNHPAQRAPAGSLWGAQRSPSPTPQPMRRTRDKAGRHRVWFLSFKETATTYLHASHRPSRHWPLVAVRSARGRQSGHTWPLLALAPAPRPPAPGAHSERTSAAKPSIKDLFQLNR